tara:strand:- start:576 stop:2276 length:1701 start_codon:yes stop_codon:yes gene_type:complete
MQQSVTNKLIANIKQSSITTGESFLKTEYVICIDSSNNRLGINTRNPRYSIEICGNDLTNALKSSYLEIDNSANIYEISSNIIRVHNELSANNIDVSDLRFNEISGNTIKTNTLILSSLNIPEISANDISVNILNVVNNINATSDISSVFNKIDVSFLRIKDTLFVDRIEDVQNYTVEDILTVKGSCDVSSLSFQTASGNYLNVIDLSVTNLEVSNNALLSSLTVENDASFSSINVSSGTFLNGPVNINAGFNIGGTDINTFVTDNINQTLKNDLIDEGNFNTINITKRLINTNNEGTPSVIDFLDIGSGGNDAKLKFGSNGSLILPLFNNIDFNSKQTRSIAFDTNGIINIRGEGNTVYEFKATNNLFYNIELSYNDYNKIKQNSRGEYTISGDNFQRYIFNKTGDTSIKYKFFDIVKKSGDVIEISNNIIKFFPGDFQYDNSRILSIHANISLRLINRVANDVELENYEFGIYPYFTNSITPDPPLIMNISGSDISDSFTSIKNSIMVFDTSYNYANSSLSYIYQNKDDTQNYLYGISFLIKQVNDTCLNNIIVDSFNCTLELN